MSSKKKIFSLVWLAVLLAGFGAFYMTSARKSGASMTTGGAEAAVYQFDTVPGAIQPIPLRANLDSRKVALGQRLFNEPRMSKDDTVSCATCHNLKKGGDDDLAFSPGVDGNLTTTNSPTVFNASFNLKQFWDGRADTLEDQINVPIEMTEMMTSWPEVLVKLQADSTYEAQFSQIYPDGLTQNNIKDAIATFERALITPNSRFDQYLRGNTGALSAREAEGYALFNDLGCVVCHQGVNVGGNLFQKMGKMQDYFDGREIKEADLGRYNVTGRERDRFVFKVPGLRNVELTAPYFHDGSAATLEESVLTMARVQLGYDLTAQEVGLLVDFLKTLTGEMPDLSS